MADSFREEMEELKSGATKMHQRLSTLLMTMRYSIGKLGQSRQSGNLDPLASRATLPNHEHQAQLENMPTRNPLSYCNFDQQSLVEPLQNQTVAQCLANLDEAELQLQAIRADLLDLKLTFRAHNRLFHVQGICSDLSSTPASRNTKS
jgi:hypothetical protein